MLDHRNNYQDTVRRYRPFSLVYKALTNLYIRMVMHVHMANV